MSWDSRAFERLRVARGGPQSIPLIAGMPDVLVDLSGLADLVVHGKLGNPLLQAVLAAQAARAEEQANGTAPLPDSDAFWARHRQMMEWQDALLAAIVIDPPWCRMADLPTDGRRPDSQLCIYDLSPEERRRGADLAFVGVDGLETFRAERRGPDAGPDGGNVSPTAERVADPDSPAPLAVLVRSGDVAPGATPHVRRHSKSGQRSA